LIHRARNRELVGYTERHHIVPRCIGGNNAVENIVKLTAEEHYVAHQLLVKMYPFHIGLKWAAMHLTGRPRNNSWRGNKLYGWIRRQVSDAVRIKATGRVMSVESRAKMSAAKQGIKRAPHSVETRAKMSAASKGRPKSAEHRAALSAAHMGLKLRPRSEESKMRSSVAIRAAFANGANRGDSKRGIKHAPHSVETKAKMSAARRGRLKSTAHCEALSASLKGKSKSAAHREALSASLKRIWADRKAV